MDLNANFIQCPFCAGHEKMSPHAVEAFKQAIELMLRLGKSPQAQLLDVALQTELYNIRNDILNRQERVDPLLR